MCEEVYKIHDFRNFIRRKCLYLFDQFLVLHDVRNTSDGVIIPRAVYGWTTPTKTVYSQPANQQLPLIDHFRRQTIVQIEKQLFLTQNFLSPGAVIEGL